MVTTTIFISRGHDTYHEYIIAEFERLIDLLYIYRGNPYVTTTMHILKESWILSPNTIKNQKNENTY